jgi:hypothetical protein
MLEHLQNGMKRSATQDLTSEEMGVVRLLQKVGANGNGGKRK